MLSYLIKAVSLPYSSIGARKCLKFWEVISKVKQSTSWVRANFSANGSLSSPKLSLELTTALHCSYENPFCKTHNVFEPEFPRRLDRSDVHCRRAQLFPDVIWFQNYRAHYISIPTPKRPKRTLQANAVQTETLKCNLFGSKRLMAQTFKRGSDSAKSAPLPNSMLLLTKTLLRRISFINGAEISER